MYRENFVRVIRHFPALINVSRVFQPTLYAQLSVHVGVWGLENSEMKTLRGIIPGYL